MDVGAQAFHSLQTSPSGDLWGTEWPPQNPHHGQRSSAGILWDVPRLSDVLDSSSVWCSLLLAQIQTCYNNFLHVICKKGWVIWSGWNFLCPHRNWGYSSLRPVQPDLATDQKCQRRKGSENWERRNSSVFLGFLSLSTMEIKGSCNTS